MNEQDKMTIEQYCEKMDVRHRRLMNVIYGLIVAIIGAGAIQLVAFGELRSKVNTNTDKIEFVEKDYTPGWYMQGMTELFSIYTRQIGALISDNNEEVARLDIDFQHTVKIMQDNFIRMRGGITQTTRGEVTNKIITK